MYTRMYVCVCMYMYMSIYVYVYVHTYVCTISSGNFTGKMFSSLW